MFNNLICWNVMCLQERLLLGTRLLLIVVLSAHLVWKATIQVSYFGTVQQFEFISSIKTLSNKNHISLEHFPFDTMPNISYLIRCVTFCVWHFTNIYSSEACKPLAESDKLWTEKFKICKLWIGFSPRRVWTNMKYIWAHFASSFLFAFI